MGNFSWKNICADYKIYSFDKLTAKTSEIGKCYFSAEYGRGRSDFSVETIFGGIRTLLYNITFDEAYHIRTIDAMGNQNGDEFTLKGKAGLTGLSLAFRSPYAANRTIVKMKKEYLENNTLMFLLNERIEKRKVYETDIFNPMLASFIPSRIECINERENVHFIGHKETVTGTRYSIKSGCSETSAQFFVFDNETGMLVKCVCGNVIFELQEFH